MAFRSLFLRVFDTNSLNGGKSVGTHDLMRGRKNEAFWSLSTDPQKRIENNFFVSVLKLNKFKSNRNEAGGAVHTIQLSDTLPTFKY